MESKEARKNRYSRKCAQNKYSRHILTSPWPVWLWPAVAGDENEELEQ